MERSSKSWRIVSYFLVLVRNFQTSIEILADKLVGGGDKRDGKFRIIFVVELIKAILKIIMFIISKGRPVLYCCLNGNSSTTTLPSIKNQPDLAGGNASCGALEKGKMSGKLMSIPNEIEFNHKLLAQMNKNETKNESNLWELVGILQPVVYISLLLGTKESLSGGGNRRSKSWLPWSVGVVMLLVHLYKTSKNVSVEEGRKRKQDLLFFSLKEPFYGTFIQPILNDLLESKSSSSFILRPVFSLLREYKWLFENSYFYTNKQ